MQNHSGWGCAKGRPSRHSIAVPSRRPLPSSSLYPFSCCPVSPAESGERSSWSSFRLPKCSARTAQQRNGWLAKPRLACGSTLHPQTELPITATETRGSFSSVETCGKFSEADGRGAMGLVIPDTRMQSTGSPAASHNPPHHAGGEQYCSVWGQGQHRGGRDTHPQ